MRRWILHVDMDAFFASVEQRDHIEYAGKPVIVGGLSGRGVVATASYEARRFGVHSAMPMIEARRRCPQAIFLTPDFNRYQMVSAKLQEIFQSFSPLMEPLSLDEAFLDISGMNLLYPSPVALAKELKSKVKSELNLIASVGLAPNKFLAKIASDMQKPDGLQIIDYGREAATIAGLSVDKIWGVGKVTAAALSKLGFFKIGDIATANIMVLQRHFGPFGLEMQQLARGIDSRPVRQHQEVQSIGREITFEQDVGDQEQLMTQLLALCEQVGRQLRQADLCGRTVTLKIRYPSFETITRSQTVSGGISLDEEIYQIGKSLFAKLPGRRVIRLLGISVSNFTDNRQVLLFAEEQGKRQKLSAVTDELKNRFGSEIVTRGRLLEDKNKL